MVEFKAPKVYPSPTVEILDSPLFSPHHASRTALGRALALAGLPPAEGDIVVNQRNDGRWTLADRGWAEDVVADDILVTAIIADTGVQSIQHAVHLARAAETYAAQSWQDGYQRREALYARREEEDSLERQRLGLLDPWFELSLAQGAARDKDDAQDKDGGWSATPDTFCEDPREWTTGDIRVIRSGSDPYPEREYANSAPMEVFDHFFMCHLSGDALRLTKRHLSIWHPETEWVCAVETLHGHSPGDWASVFACIDVPAGSDRKTWEGYLSGAIQTFAQWRRGDAWLVSPPGDGEASRVFADSEDEAIAIVRADRS